MSRIRYSKDVDALTVELSADPIDYAEESGPFIIHFSCEGRPVLVEILSARDFLLTSLTSVIKDSEASLT